MDIHKLWSDFAQRHDLSELQLEQFKIFYTMLAEHNLLFNLTAITEVPAFIPYHLDDSLMLSSFLDISQVEMLADVGTGGGFPGIPFKIKYPDLPMVLIEVSRKKIGFLLSVLEALELSGVEIYSCDWRTFLRKTDYPIDIVCARASLQPTELMRMFQPGSTYKNAQLVYWAAETWQPNLKEQRFIERQEFYKIKHKKRKLVFFKLSAEL